MRPQDWPGRLALFVEEKRSAPFIWGENDCCLFSADWAAMLTGVDAAAGLRGKYSTALGAYRLLQPVDGVAGMFATIAAKCGWPEVSPKRMRRGDVAVLLIEGHETGAVCDGPQLAVPGKDGLVFYSARLAQRAWRID